jgi:hypothetical protein
MLTSVNVNKPCMASSCLAERYDCGSHFQFACSGTSSIKQHSVHCIHMACKASPIDAALFPISGIVDACTEKFAVQAHQIASASHCSSAKLNAWLLSSRKW